MAAMAIMEGKVQRSGPSPTTIEIVGSWREAPDPAHKGAIDQVRGIARSGRQQWRPSPLLLVEERSGASSSRGARAGPPNGH
jgi:hypothetical protein